MGVCKGTGSVVKADIHQVVLVNLLFGGGHALSAVLGQIPIGIGDVADIHSIVNGVRRRNVHQVNGGDVRVKVGGRVGCQHRTVLGGFVAVAPAADGILAFGICLGNGKGQQILPVRGGVAQGKHHGVVILCRGGANPLQSAAVGGGVLGLLKAVYHICDGERRLVRESQTAGHDHLEGGAVCKFIAGGQVGLGGIAAVQVKQTLKHQVRQHLIVLGLGGKRIQAVRLGVA